MKKVDFLLSRGVWIISSVALVILCLIAIHIEHFLHAPASLVIGTLAFQIVVFLVELGLVLVTLVQFYRMK